jgi:hypothetical protein
MGEAGEFKSLLRTLLCATLATAGVVGCSGEATVDSNAGVAPVTSGAHATIFGGARDTAQTLSGVVALKVSSGSTFELCTGALVAPNVVLTARHCVSKIASSTVVCDINGKSANGDHVTGDVDAASIQIFTGSDPELARSPAAHGKTIVHGGGKVLCDADIALVVLDAKLDGVPVMPVRIGQPIHPGESATAATTSRSRSARACTRTASTSSPSAARSARARRPSARTSSRPA